MSDVILDLDAYDDVSNVDIYDLAAGWGREVVTLSHGLLAVRIKSPIQISSQRGPHTTFVQTGNPDDVLLVSNQRMQRYIISHHLFEFLYDEKMPA